MDKKVYKEGDILKAMQMHLDEDSIVYGANGHYGIGGYYDITKVSSVFGDKDYNSQDNLDAASGATAVEEYNKEVDEDFQKAIWMKNI